MNDEFEEALRMLEELEAQEGSIAPPSSEPVVAPLVLPSLEPPMEATAVVDELGQEPVMEELPVVKEEKSLESMSNRERWEELLEAIHPGAWDFVDIPSISSNTLVIKFPHIVIRNRNNSTHIIRDLYVFWGLNDTYGPSKSLTGWRGVRSWDEYQSRYSHSHLQVGPGSLNNRFCTGSGEFANLINGLNSGGVCNWDDIQKALVMLHLYVEWESINGTPFIRFDNVYNKSGSWRRSAISDEMYNPLFKNLITTMGEEDVSPMSVTSINGTMMFACNEDVIKPHLIIQLRNLTDQDHLNVVDSEGRETPLRTVLSQDNAFKPTESQIKEAESNLCYYCSYTNIFHFRGKEVTPKIFIPEEQAAVVKEEDLNIVPDQITARRVYSMLEEQINKYAIDNQYESESM